MLKLYDLSIIRIIKQTEIISLRAIPEYKAKLGYIKKNIGSEIRQDLFFI